MGSAIRDDGVMPMENEIFRHTYHPHTELLVRAAPLSGSYRDTAAFPYSLERERRNWERYCGVSGRYFGYVKTDPK
jgi:hypothetical protein